MLANIAVHTIGKISIPELSDILTSKNYVVIVGRAVLSSNTNFSNYFVSNSHACKFFAMSEILSLITSDPYLSISNEVLSTINDVTSHVSVHSIYIGAPIRHEVLNFYVERSVNNWNIKTDYQIFDIYIITDVTVITQLPKITIEI